MPLNTDIFGAFEKLGKCQSNRKATVFPVPTRSMNAQLLKEAIRGRSQIAVRNMIRAENAPPVLNLFPIGTGSLHVLLCGDFVFFDLLVACIEKHGPPVRIDISTLSMSSKNIIKLVHLLETTATEIRLLLSVYFAQTSERIYRELLTSTAPFPRFQLTSFNTHCKLILIDYPERAWVLESSANLRSCRSLEQLTVFDNRELLEFHRAWMEEARTNATLNPRGRKTTDVS